ncbi:MAG: hypothetical protein OQK82_06275 [Candidatus Pacearchaeota archaeon]|nr:hypothetical protein [Candidatus Pacearchaeota archaeon]
MGKFLMKLSRERFRKEVKESKYLISPFSQDNNEVIGRLEKYFYFPTNLRELTSSQLYVVTVTKYFGF